jgi:hypothetical protein
MGNIYYLYGHSNTLHYVLMDHTLIDKSREVSISTTAIKAYISGKKDT